MNSDRKAVGSVDRNWRCVGLAGGLNTSIPETDLDTKIHEGLCNRTCATKGT